MTLLPKNVEIAVGLRLLSLWQWLYETTDGAIGERFGHVEMLLLRTTGRRTGASRTVALLFVRDGKNLAVVGSKGGSDTPPAWLLNLEATPEAEVQIGRRRLAVRARIAGAAERARLWRLVNEKWPYDDYQSRTSRPIPIVILEPR